MKAKKSLQPFNNFLSGWVLEAAIKHYDKKCLLIGTVSQITLFLHLPFLSRLNVSKMQIKCFKLSLIFLGIRGSMILPHKVSYNKTISQLIPVCFTLQVRHSQHANKAPLKPWVLLQEDGEIETAHCTCMAGLGEAFSHVSSLLFYIEAFSRAKEANSCTQEECKWLQPKAVKEVPYLPVDNIDFRGATRKMTALHCGNMDENSNKPVKKKKTGETQDLNKDQRQRIFETDTFVCSRYIVRFANV